MYMSTINLATKIYEVVVPLGLYEFNLTWFGQDVNSKKGDLKFFTLDPPKHL